ncbi:hypothetical protein DPMN_152370 [Dreissena polymorpha]|uniref:Uncharacterized protein n=1 Tax=Dreissena polymorpha TaxID=45954 RepID=A0A9D4FMW6_DREPO|nr:hypothetical protein DPMN_152370 [Dreissena polymorpha]
MVLYTSFPDKENYTGNPVGSNGVSNAGLVQKHGFLVPRPKSDGQSHVKKTWETFFKHKLRFPDKKRYLPMGVRAELVAKGLLNPEKIASIENDYRLKAINAPDQGNEATGKKALIANYSDSLNEMTSRITVTVVKEIDRNNNHGAPQIDSKLTTAETFEEYARKQLEELDEFLKTVDAILTENKVKPIVYKDSPVEDLLDEINAVLEQNGIQSWVYTDNDARMANIATQINANVSGLFPLTSHAKITLSNEPSQAKDLLLGDVCATSSNESVHSVDDNNINCNPSTTHRKRKRNVTNESFSDYHGKRRRFSYDPVTFDVDKKRSPATILLETNCKDQHSVRLSAKRAAPKDETTPSFQTTLPSETTLPKKRKFLFKPITFP